jgi:putative flavoprotein involved in K+ transport
LVALWVGARGLGFRIDTGRLLRRQAVVGGREVLEAIFAFETVNGPGYGAVRLLREADGVARAWTI